MVQVLDSGVSGVWELNFGIEGVSGLVQSVRNLGVRFRVQFRGATSLGVEVSGVGFGKFGFSYCLVVGGCLAGGRGCRRRGAPACLRRVLPNPSPPHPKTRRRPNPDPKTVRVGPYSPTLTPAK